MSPSNEQSSRDHGRSRTTVGPAQYHGPNHKRSDLYRSREYNYDVTQWQMFGKRHSSLLGLLFSDEMWNVILKTKALMWKSEGCLGSVSFAKNLTFLYNIFQEIIFLKRRQNFPVFCEDLKMNWNSIILKREVDFIFLKTRILFMWYKEYPTAKISIAIPRVSRA